jgi:hypothetical protein
MNTHTYKYIKYKYKNLQINNIKQIGGNRFNQWYENLWGKTKLLDNTGRKEIVDKPNSNILFMDNIPIKFSFVPEIWNENDEQSEPIKNTIQNKKILLDYFKSKEWKCFLKYTFNMLKSYYLPHYYPEMYNIDKIKTSLEEINSVIIIVIKGIIKKYSYKEIKYMYNKSEESNKLWYNKTDEKMTFGVFYDLVVEAFYTITEEGEVYIEGLGRLVLGIDTHMKMEKE